MDFTYIQTLQKHISIIEQNKDTIVEIWMDDSEVQTILSKHTINIDKFGNEYAMPVLKYFIGIVHGENSLGNCPVITKLLEYLKDKDITASELFIICIKFRKSIIQLSFSKNIMNNKMYDNISYIFDANFRGVLEAFGDTISSAKAENKRLYDISTKDYLTKIFNRKKFDEIFKEELNEANEINKKLSLVLLDIDYFKKVNDTHGHDKGDEVLINLTQIVKQYIRGSDILARWGGEEFILLLPKAEKHNAMRKAELIRKAIEQHSFTTIGNNITCSFGIAGYELGDTESSLFKRVDTALYMSKSNGRNQITLQ